MKKAPPVQFAKIPNNIIGHLFLWVLRHWINSERYSIVTRGRKPRRVIRYSYDVPKANAAHAGILEIDRQAAGQEDR